MRFWEDIPLKTKILFVLFIVILYCFILMIFLRVRQQNINMSIVDWITSSKEVNSLEVPLPEQGKANIILEFEMGVFNGPGDDYDLLGVIEKGVNVQIEGTSQDGNWLAIRIDKEDNIIGWFKKESLQVENIALLPVLSSSGEVISISTPTPLVPSVTALMKASILSGPGSTYDELAILEVGKSAEVVGKSQDEQWWVIKVPYLDQGIGYISAEEVIAEYVDSVPVEEIPVVTAVMNVNIRSGPGLDFRIIALLENGQSTTILGKSADELWWFVEVPESAEKGWISIDYVVSNSLGDVPVINVEEDDQKINIPTPDLNQPSLSTSANVNVRSGPGETYDVLTRLEYGKTALIVGISSDNRWWAIKILNSQQEYGWVSGDYVIVIDVEDVQILE